MDIFPGKNVIQVRETFFPSPQTRRQVSATANILGLGYLYIFSFRTCIQMAVFCSVQYGDC